MCNLTSHLRSTLDPPRRPYSVITQELAVGGYNWEGQLGKYHDLYRGRGYVDMLLLSSLLEVGLRALFEIITPKFLRRREIILLALY